KKITDYTIFTGTDRNKDGKLHHVMFPIGYFRSKMNDRLLLVGLNTAYDRGKRGLRAVIPETGDVVWEFLFGPQVFNPQITDIDGDSIDEIVTGSYAPANAVEYNSYMDTTAYIFVLNSDGKLKWHKRIGPYWTGANPIVADLDGDGCKEVCVYSYGTNPERKSQAPLIVFDGRSGKYIDEVRAGKQFTALAGTKFNSCADFNNDRRDELVIGNLDGKVRIFNGELDEIYTSVSFGGAVTVAGIGDLDGNKIPEVICVTSDNRMIILNYELKLLKSIPLKYHSDISLLKRHSKFYIFLRKYTDPQHFEYELLELTKIPPVQRIASKNIDVMIWVLVLLMIVLSFIIFRDFFWGSQAKKILYSFLDSAGLMERTLILNKKGRILKTGSGWEVFCERDIRGADNKHFIVLSDDQQVITALRLIIERKESEVTFQYKDEKIYRLVSNYIPIMKAFVIILNDLSEQEHLHQVKAWAPVAQRLAHGIKNPLTTVKLEAEELRDLLDEKYGIRDADSEASLQAIIDETARLKKMSDGFMRFVEFEKSKLQQIDINDKIDEQLSAFCTIIPAGITVQKDMKAGLPPINVDTEQFAFVVDSIVHNAIEAMDGKGRLIISSRLVELFPESDSHKKTKKYVELEFRDTGNGIPAEFLTKIFDPYFTLKKGGTGLGLSIVKKIMIDHGGDVVVYSEEGKGTTVSLRFPVTDRGDMQ
ncbi:hypothetical protein GF337_19500, partial [candidate division KSB1 bacterium]|nr:hypothetical protein [candidate division KSB1 bacterium]